MNFIEKFEKGLVKFSKTPVYKKEIIEKEVDGKIEKEEKEEFVKHEYNIKHKSFKMDDNGNSIEIWNSSKIKLEDIDRTVSEYESKVVELKKQKEIILANSLELEEKKYI